MITDREMVCIVRCKDCRYWQTRGCPMTVELTGVCYQLNNENDYCSWGKKEMGMVTTVGSLEDMCAMMCDNDVPDQSAKADAGKPQVTLVPREIIRDIAAVRMYGNQKYGDPDNWKTVGIGRYRDAMMRHMLDYLDDPTGVDKESGLPHLWHLACNVAFLCEMEKEMDEEW